MSVSNVGVSSGAYSYLQSILQQEQSTTGAPSAGDPVAALLNAFYPSGSSAPSTSSAPSDGSGAASGSLPNPLPFSPDTMGALISAQEQAAPQDRIAAHAQRLFGEFDTDGDGQISKTEFETAFGSGADMSKVDGLFNALDSNGDGAVSQDELTSAARGSHGHHHHHHTQVAGGGQGGGLAELLSGTDVTGATSATSSNTDGSTTTTISYADGSKVTLTTSAAAGVGNSQDSGNLFEQLIKLQSQMLAQSAGAISSSVAALI